MALLLHLPDRSQPVPWLVVALALVGATVIITGAIHLQLNAAIQDAAPALLDVADPGPGSRTAGCAGTSYAP